MLLADKQEKGGRVKMRLRGEKNAEHIVHNITIIRSVASRPRG
ncbi:hypothetical protein D088_630017 [Salmonella enterica subsp. houtenae serovar 16:z4,z32:-- str. RKS3027]|nr:hypothetical protein D088_630017 [Salmonella enterica subsp. houtenae serovar 16:z4,z32:-- str. RKS3027]